MAGTPCLSEPGCERAQSPTQRHRTSASACEGGSALGAGSVPCPMRAMNLPSVAADWNSAVLKPRSHRSREHRRLYAKFHEDVPVLRDLRQNVDGQDFVLVEEGLIVRTMGVGSLQRGQRAQSR